MTDKKIGLPYPLTSSNPSCAHWDVETQSFLSDFTFTPEESAKIAREYEEHQAYLHEKDRLAAEIQKQRMSPWNIFNSFLAILFVGTGAVEVVIFLFQKLSHQ